MSENPKASIIINNYNYGRFLAEAIDSALAQTHQNTEVIVVDDGSTDESRDLIGRYGEQVIAVLKENGGQASAYNAGFAVATGDIFCFLDADDTLVETAMTEAVAAFQDSQLVKVEWQLGIMDDQGRMTGGIVPEKPLPSVDLRELTLSNGPFYDWLITPPSSGNSYRYSMLEQVLPIPEPPFYHGADVYLSILAPLFGGVHRLPQPQGHYRVHDNNNYFGRPLDKQRLRDYVRRFEDCCAQLKNHLGKQDIDAEPKRWKERNFNYLWPTRLLHAKADIESVVPATCSYVLIDENEWGNEEPVEGRHAIRFLERDGAYWGPPGDDDIAIAELERHRQRGAKFMIIWWTCFWWLEHYQCFKEYLYSRFPCPLSNDCVIMFELDSNKTIGGPRRTG
jgi:glycosyltransferase involved in cell wall biosynthesis